ncbi:hypothetical protein VTJ04DRAFT_590 [Mycothermus thermophilus]|uniref:uncharacterized protein n=1 Tax=Humicola insolens TaxID=85995 RepID=UPI003743458F
MGNKEAARIMAEHMFGGVLSWAIWVPLWDLWNRLFFCAAPDLRVMGKHLRLVYSGKRTEFAVSNNSSSHPSSIHPNCVLYLSLCAGEDL